MVDKIGSITGYTQGVAVDMDAIDKIVEADEQRTIEEIKQYQPDTRNDFFGKGPEAWHSTSYIRQQEIYGANVIGMIN